MSKMTKIARWAIAATFLSMPLAALAALPVGGGGIPVVTLPAGTGLDLGKIGAIVSTIANYLIVIGVVIAVIFIIWGGLRYMLARGDEAAAKKAKDSIFHGIIGAAIVLGVGVLLETVSFLVTRSFFGAGQ